MAATRTNDDELMFFAAVRSRAGLNFENKQSTVFNTPYEPFKMAEQRTIVREEF